MGKTKGKNLEEMKTMAKDRKEWKKWVQEAEALSDTWIGMRIGEEEEEKGNLTHMAALMNKTFFESYTSM